MKNLYTLYAVTGGQSQRDQVLVQATSLESVALMGGGPLDAPAYIPAGSCNSTDCCNWRMEKVPMSTLVAREAAPC
jgi:hypothetical protein